jgi:hypothetical protein
MDTRDIENMFLMWRRDQAMDNDHETYTVYALHDDHGDVSIDEIHDPASLHPSALCVNLYTLHPKNSRHGIIVNSLRLPGKNT